jgi:hypothetical protein
MQSHVNISGELINILTKPISINPLKTWYYGWDNLYKCTTVDDYRQTSQTQPHTYTVQQPWSFLTLFYTSEKYFPVIASLI